MALTSGSSDGAQMVGDGLALRPAWRDSGRAPSRGSRPAASGHDQRRRRSRRAQWPCAQAGRPGASSGASASRAWSEARSTVGEPWRCRARPWRPASGRSRGRASIPACAEAQLPASMASNTPRQSRGTTIERAPAAARRHGDRGRRRVGRRRALGWARSARADRRSSCASGGCRPEQSAKANQPRPQASSSISSSRSCHASDLSKGR